MNDDVLIIGSFCVTAIVLVLGVPLVRAFVRRADRRDALPAPDMEAQARLRRIEQGLEAVAIEVERISEGQRFVTKLLAERGDATKLPPT